MLYVIKQEGKRRKTFSHDMKSDLSEQKSTLGCSDYVTDNASKVHIGYIW